MNSKTMIAGLVIAVIIIVAAVVVISSGYTGASGNSVKTPILLTDPATVPAGTSAMVVSYSSLMVHSTSASGSGWVSATGSGSVDLIAVQNSSQLIGYAYVGANSSINQVQMDVIQATITVNGTTHAVAVQNSTMTVNVNNAEQVNSNSAVVIDVSPVVSGSYNQTSNTSNYTMTSTAQAVIAINVNVSASANVGSTVKLNVNGLVN